MCCSLEERQRVEKKMRESKQEEFSPRWFKLSGDVAPTPTSSASGDSEP